MPNSNKNQSQSWQYEESWLLRILGTVAGQAYRKLGRRCQVEPEDIEQDLALAAFSDSAFLGELKRTKRKGRAEQAAYRFAQNASRRCSRRYLAKWPRLIQWQAPAA